MAKKSELLVADIVNRFLTSMRVGAAKTTWQWYEGFLRPFARNLGRVRANEFTPSQVRRWIAIKYGAHSPSTQHAAARAIVRAFNWSVSERLLSQSPLTGFRKPAPSRREFIPSARQYAACVKVASGPVRDIIKFLWHSGARPQELRMIQGVWIVDRKIIVPQLSSKGKRQRRVIYLDPLAAAVAGRLAREHATGPIFRTKTGRPLKKDGLSKSIRLIGRAAGVPGLCPYAFRHAFITRLLEKGVDVATVAALAGNSPRMVLEVYSHVAQNDNRLLRQLG